MSKAYETYGRQNLISEFIAECADERLKLRALNRDLAKALVVARHERRMGRLDWCIERDIRQYADGLSTRR
jgi:hypothetical protein